MILQDPIVYITNGAPQSLEPFSQVAAFAERLGNQVMIARLQPKTALDAAPDARFSSALAASGANPPSIVAVDRRKPGAGLMQHDQIRTGTLALQSQRRGGVNRVLFGNLHERLLRETPLPLLALPRDGKIGNIATVLFPADLSPRSVAAFAATIALCQQLGANLSILHVYGNDRLPPSAEEQARRLAAKSPRELLMIHREGIVALVEQARAAGVQASEHMAEGRAHSAILAFSSKNPTDLIAMPTHGPQTIEDVVNGTTTSQVIQRSPVPVLVFRA